MPNSYGKTADEMLDEMLNNDVSIRVYTTSRFYLDLEKKDDNVTLKVEASGMNFLVVIREAYDRWHELLEGKLGRHLGMPQIEHHQAPEAEKVADKAPADLDDDPNIPF